MADETDDYRAKLSAYIADAEKLVLPRERQAHEYVLLSQSWASLIVKNAFIANAGGAGVIPIVDRLLQSPVAGAPGSTQAVLDIVDALWWFGGGIICAAITCFFAYLNFGALGASTDADARQERDRIIKLHLGGGYNAAELAAVEAEEATADRWVALTTWPAIVFGLLSYAAFGGGLVAALVN